MRVQMCIRDRDISIGDREDAVGHAYLRLGDANPSAINRANLARMVRQDAELADSRGNGHVGNRALEHALLGADDAQLHGHVLRPHLGGALAHVVDGAGVTAVSYTHLDVYKRQVIMSSRQCIVRYTPTKARQPQAVKSKQSVRMGLAN